MPEQCPESYEGKAWATPEEALAMLQEWARDHGFAIAQSRGSDRDPVTRQHRRYDVCCTAGGREYTPTGYNIRQTSTKRTNCLFRGKLVCRRSHDDLWVYNSLCTEHNHEPLTCPSGDPVHRKRTLEDLEEIRVASESAGCGGRAVVAIVKAKRPEALLTRRDVWNDRAKLRREALGPYSQTQAFISNLSADDTFSRYTCHGDTVSGVFWSLPACMDGFKAYHDVLSIK
ncbi:hypothetical protein V1509DRAFT_640047 [Lipomyces kononenkoae]